MTKVTIIEGRNVSGLPHPEYSDRWKGELYNRSGCGRNTGDCRFDFEGYNIG